MLEVGKLRKKEIIRNTKYLASAPDLHIGRVGGRLGRQILYIIFKYMYAPVCMLYGE